MQITIKTYLLAKLEDSYDYNTGEMKKETKFSLWDVDISASSPEYVKVSEQDISLEVPDDFDPRIGYVAGLERLKESIGAEFQARVTEINAQIQSLLAIEA